jgi:glycerophosphoryl diester phosphodiesterase
MASAVVILSTLLAGLMPAPALGKTVDDAGRPITNKAGQTFVVVAHRGGLDRWPENSVEAYQHAAAADFEAIEADIVFTKDRLPVMTHYDLVQPQCTGAGQRIHNLTWAQVSQLRCADANGDRTVPLPSFAELAAILARYPRVQLFLDIKSFSGQSAAGRREYAKRSVELVKAAGLLGRTRFVTFSWDKTLPTLRKYAPKAYLVAYDHAQLSFTNAKLAAKLGADSYGPEVRYSTATLARYVRSLGMDFVPWQPQDAENFASTVYFGPKKLWLIADDPGLVQEQLKNNEIELDAPAVRVTRTLATPVTVSQGRFAAKKAQYPKVLGTVVPATDQPMLETVDLTISISGLRSTAKLYLGGRGTAYREVKVRVDKRTKTVKAKVIVGDAGKLRVWCDHAVTLKLRATGYTRLRFPDARGGVYRPLLASPD